jgi:hypothetical protein
MELEPYIVSPLKAEVAEWEAGRCVFVETEQCCENKEASFPSAAISARFWIAQSSLFLGTGLAGRCVPVTARIVLTVKGLFGKFWFAGPPYHC